MNKSIQDLTSQQLNNLVTSDKSVVRFNNYSTEDYLAAIERLQLRTYQSADLVWGRQWKQKLSSTFPFILKLLYKGYNNFLVFPISSHNNKWFIYSEDEFVKYAKYANVPEFIYQIGWSYLTKQGRNSWHTVNPFIDTIIREDNYKRIGRYIEYLAEVGAITKVADSYVNINTNYMYSSKYIISKDKLRELVSLFLNTFTNTFSHTTILSSYTISSSSYTPYTHYYTSLPTLGDKVGANNEKVCQNDTVIGKIKWNNELLPDEEQMSYNGRRIYSEVCSYLNEDKHAKIPAGQMTKQMYLDKVFGQNNWFEFDRRGSIYNLTKSLNEHTYLDNSVDIYEKMNNITFSSKEERELYKTTQMSVYFSTGRRQVNYFIRNLTKKLESGFIPESDNKIINAYWKLCDCDENTTWNEFIERFYKHYNLRKKNMKKFIGDNKWLIDKGSKYRRNTYIRNEDTFIFMRESEIYLEFVSKLRERGLRVVQIYDGFYLEKGSISEEELNKLLESILI